jgi:hypothetical protein
MRFPLSENRDLGIWVGIAAKIKKLFKLATIKYTGGFYGRRYYT